MFVYNTEESKDSSSSAISRKDDNFVRVKWFILMKHLMHVNARHDQITLFSVHVNNEVGTLMTQDFDQIEEILHM